MKNKYAQDKSVSGKQQRGSALVRGLLACAAIGVLAMPTVQAAGQRSQESMREAYNAKQANGSTQAFEQDAHSLNMARLRAENSAEIKRKNAAAKAAQEAAAAKAAAAQAAAAQAATPAVPAEPATKQ